MSVPVELGRDEAQRLAARELAKAEYHRDDPGLLERLVDYLLQRLQDVLGSAARSAPGGGWSLALLAVLLVVAVAAVLLVTGRVRRRHGVEQPLFAATRSTADDHRRRAEEHAGAGRWDEAVRERLRAVVRSLEGRALLEPRAGRTADEAAVEAGELLPDCAGDLRAAARAFDDVWYGGRRADAATYARLREADDRVQRARPRAAAAVDVPVLAVPR